MRIDIVETHDEALPLWEAGAPDRVLVHVDAHHDMWACGDVSSVTPANLVRAALRAGLAGSVCWIVPDPAWDSRASRVALLKHLRRIADPDARLREGPGEIETSVERRPVRVRPWRALPTPSAPVLLDIDADFMTIGSIEYKRREAAVPPWISAALVAERLRPMASAADRVTIARSCDGGFTPLVSRGIADELCARLAGDRPRAAAFSAVADGLAAWERGDAVSAERILAAQVAGPAAAAACFALATIDVSRGRTRDARAWCDRAVGADAAYRSPYRSRGFIEYFAGRLRSAERHFEQALRMDPDDPFAHLGLGMTARASRRLDDAESALTRALDLDRALTDAHRERAEVFVERRRWDRAREGFVEAIRLVGAGGRTMAPDGWQSGGPDAAWMHARLAFIAGQTGDFAAAARHAAHARSAGFDTAALRGRMAALSLRERSWRAANGHAAAAIRLTVRQCLHDVRVATEDLALAIRR